jgi:hypothetical protein
MMLNAEIPITLWALLGVFCLISIILAVSTAVNVIRLRNVRMSWKAGKMKGYPLFSTLFLGVTIIMVGIGLYQDSIKELALASLYMLLASGWFITSYLASKRFVTNHGIVKNVNDPSQTIAWHQIRDFVEEEQKESTRFLFIYSESASESPGNILRLNLKVPSHKLSDFKKLISHKLGRRITCYETESIKVEHFD